MKKAITLIVCMALTAALLAACGAQPAEPDLDELAFQLARALWNAANRMEDYQPALADMAEEGFMDQQLTIPLHPGAERFYMGLADL